MKYQALQYVVLSDGSVAYVVLQEPLQPLDDIISFGMGIIFMVIMVGMMRSLMADIFKPKETPELLTDTQRKKAEKIGTVWTATARLYNAAKEPIATCLDTPNAIARAFMELPEARFVSQSYSSKLIPREKYADRMQHWNVTESHLEMLPDIRWVRHQDSQASAIEAAKRQGGDRYVFKNPYGFTVSETKPPPGQRYLFVSKKGSILSGGSTFSISLPQTADKTGHRHLFEKLEAMTPEQRAKWAQTNGWGSTADSAYRSLFSSMLRIPLKKGETWRDRAVIYMQKYYPETIVVYPPAPETSETNSSTNQPSSKSGNGWGDILKQGAEIAIPAIIGALLADNRPLAGLDLLPDVEEAKAKVESLIQKLKQGVEEIQQSDYFRTFLTTMGKFHDYSIGNMILIMLQKPNATHVAGFNTWKELGRYVKPGEKGIAILAPVMPPRPTCEKCGAKISHNSKFCRQCGAEVEPGVETVSPRFFRVVYVFDLSQTEGKPLPEFEVPALSGEANEELFKKTLELAAEQGLSVSFEPKPELDPEIKGYLSGKQIWVRPEESRAQQLKTLLHEVAHYYTEDVFGIPRKDAETIAESVAFAVGAHFGFDSGTRSFPYVALWSQDKKVLEQNLAAIRKVTSQIINALEALP